MAPTVRVNGLTLAHRGTGGYVRSTLPDVCLTPAGSGMAPIPYTNTSFITTLTKGTHSVRADGGNMIANKGSEQASSVGDEPGTGGGVISGVNKDRATWLSWSPDVFMEGKPACRLTDKMLLNRGNTVSIGGHWDPKIKGDKTLEDLCMVACECELKYPGDNTGQRDKCFQQGIRDIGYNGNYPTPETMMNGFLTNVTYVLVNGVYEMRTSGTQTTMPSSNPYSPKGSIRPDVPVRENGETTRIVEVKFGGDTASRNQTEQYPKVAPTKFLKVDDECDCKGYKQDKDEAEGAKRLQEATEGSENDIARLTAIMRLLRGGGLFIPHVPELEPYLNPGYGGT